MNPLLRWIKWRIEHNKNCIIVVNGPTGSGKTYVALTLGVETSKMFGTNFSIKNNVDFGFKDLLKKMALPNNQSKGTPFVLEEAGAMGGGGSSREWQSQANKFLFSFTQTSRHRGHVFILTCPYFTYLDAGTRKLVHLQLVMDHINFKDKLSIAKPYILQVNNRTGDIYFKYLRFRTHGSMCKIKEMDFKYPPLDVVDEYELEKNKYTSRLNKKIIEESEAKEGKKHREFKIDYIVMDLLIKENKLTNREVANKCVCSIESVKARRSKLLKTGEVVLKSVEKELKHLRNGVFNGVKPNLAPI